MICLLPWLQLNPRLGSSSSSSSSIDRWLVPPNLRNDKETLVKKVSKLRPYQLSLPYLKNNYVYLSFLIVYISINLGLFISRAIEYKGKGGLTIVARACGEYYLREDYAVADQINVMKMKQFLPWGRCKLS